MQYKCTKCGCTDYDQDEIRTTGGISRFFDIQNKSFAAVICRSCGYTELFRQKSGMLGNVFDFLNG